MLYLFQTKLIFPGAASQGDPDALVEPMPRSELVRLTTASGEKTVALFGKALLPNGTVAPNAASRPTVLFFYGNGMYLNVALGNFAMFRDAGANCIAVEYLGYGMAEGKPSEAGCYASAEAAWQYLLTRPDIDTRKLIPAGWSLGGAVAIDLARKHKDEGRVVGLVTFCTFTSMPDMARHHYPMFPAGLVLQHRFDSEQKLPAVIVPHLLGHGRKDPLIPFSHADRLAAVSKSVRLTRFTSETAGHNDFFELTEQDLPPVLKTWLSQF
jgi:pimeloyl-ACP methyl ester carboxylesterase